MTDKNLTEVVAIIDRSGSMNGLVSDTIGGYNSFVEEQKKGEGRTIFTLVQFDTEYQIDYEGVDVNDVKPLDKSTYIPRGATALLDAVGRTVNVVGQRLANTPEEKRPGQVIFVVITDGEENSSREFKAQQVKDMVKHQIEKYSWSFVYLGGGDIESQKEQGLSLGIAAANVYNYSTSNSVGTKNVYTNVSKGVLRRKMGMAVSADASAYAAQAATESLLEEDEVDSLMKDSE